MHVEKTTSWNGLVGLLNVILVVNTLLISAQVSLLGLVQPTSELNAWQKSWTGYFFNCFAMGVTIEAMGSVYSTAVLALLCFIDESEEKLLDKYKQTFKYSLVVVSCSTIMAFWVSGIQTIASIAYIDEDHGPLKTVQIWFVIGTLIIVPYLLYVAYKVRFVFDETSISTDEVNGMQVSPLSVSPINQTSETIEEALTSTSSAYSKYVRDFEEAEIKPVQLVNLTTDHLTGILNVPLGDALRMVEHFKARRNLRRTASVSANQAQMPTSVQNVPAGTATTTSTATFSTTGSGMNRMGR